MRRRLQGVTSAAVVASVIVVVFGLALVAGSSGTHSPRTRAEPTSDETPTTWFDVSPEALPDCIPVDSRSQSDVGCELKSDFVALSPDPKSPGIPVHDDTGAQPGAVVGYIVPGIDQFVPLDLTKDPATLAELKQCNAEALEKAPLDDGCVPLLVAMGTPRGFLPRSASGDTP